jgi:hypothetical protein
MSLRRADHPVLVLPCALLAVSYFIGGDLGAVLMGVAFWLVIYVNFTSCVELEDGRVVITIGRPLPLVREEIPLDEIVEIIETPPARGIRLVTYLERPWVMVWAALVGLLVGSLLLVRGEPYGVLWIYFAVLFSFDYVLSPSETKLYACLVLILTVLTAFVLFLLNTLGFILLVLAMGAFMVIRAYEHYDKGAIIIKTDDRTVVLLGDSESRKVLVRALERALGGKAGVQAT